MNSDNESPIIYFYVERVEKKNNIMLLDFIQEDDYIVVTHTPQLDIDIESVSRHFVKPSMIMINNFPSSAPVHEGLILTMQRKVFVRMIFEEGASVARNVDDSTDPAQILLTFRDGTRFANMINNNDIKLITESEYTDTDSFIDKFGWVVDSSDNTTKGDFKEKAEFLSSFDDTESSMIVWDVGQGNANGVYNDASAVLFDFGAPMYASVQRTLQYYASTVSVFQNKTYGLIISHWDIDHYKMLCYAPDSFFNNIQFIAFPTRVIRYTAKQLLNRMSSLCRNKCFPVIPTTSIKNGSFDLVIWNGPFHLYVGASRMNINNSGLFLIVSGLSSYGLFTGDRTNWNNTLNLWWPGKGQAMNIVVPHHGGNSKTIPDSNSITHPHIAAISVGNNTYSHPTQQTINTYKARGYKIERTDNNGTIVIPLGILY